MKQTLKKVVTQKEALENLLGTYKKIQAQAKSRLEKYQDLTSRRSAEKWSEDKKKKSANRLIEANKELRDSTLIIEQIETQLENLTR